MRIERTNLNRLRTRLACLGVLFCCALPLSAQDRAAPGDRDELMSRPSAYGVRFTPKMARAMARFYVDQMIVTRYELDESKVDKAGEAVARRLMEMAHTLDGTEYNASLEDMMAGIFEAQLGREDRAGRRGPPPKIGMAIAKGVLPALPAVRELIRGVGQDIRPMLSVGQQLNFGKDLMLAEAAFDTFEKSMDRWAKGEMRPGENPFREDGGTVEKEKDGHSRAYNNAERIADRAIEKGEWTQWEKYVASAKTFYEFDDAQAATADSILQECLDRVEAATQQDRWRKQAHRNRAWFHMLWHLGIGSAHPLRYHIKAEYARICDPVQRIGEDLKRRIDEIPTRVQRQAAEKRMLAALTEQGYRETPMEQEEAEEPREQSPDEKSQDETDSGTGV